MGKHSDYKKLDELAAWDMDKGCRSIVDQSTPARRRLKAKLKRQARKRINREKADEQEDGKMEYPPPVYLTMLSLFAGHISLDEALRRMDLREQKEQEGERWN